MARNRKRRSDRRPRRPADDPARRRGVATAPGQRRDPVRERDGDQPQAADDAVQEVAPESPASRQSAEPTPDPIEHATPDVELAEAQMAVGRPADQVAEDEDLEDEDLDDEDLDDEESEDGGAALARRRSTAPAPRGVARLVQFFQGSWRELQRVQWPDRRQVMQATGVVIGFVIVAGVFLGVADWVAGKVVHFILD
ncbi:MAG: preprotein translocase subunit SecE [Solirubrobacterales bacterium]|nr:preprotein translocase subunit SecE [Solirubrobacterales bacterium]